MAQSAAIFALSQRIGHGACAVPLTLKHNETNRNSPDTLYQGAKRTIAVMFNTSFRDSKDRHETLL